MTFLAAGPTTAGSSPPVEHRHRVAYRRVHEALSGLIGAVLGLAPHVLHHVGFLVGTAFVAGSGGTVLLGAIGAVAALPLLWRLHRRFRTWRIPMIAAVVFVGMFAFSTLVIGPLINGGSKGGTPAPPTAPHQDHH